MKQASAAPNAGSRQLTKSAVSDHEVASPFVKWFFFKFAPPSPASCPAKDHPELDKLSMKPLITLGAALLLSTQLSAQELILGLGYADYSEGSALDAQTLELEYISAPLRHYGNFAVSLGAVASFDSEDNAFLGAGLAGTYDFAPRWFAQASLMPGVFVEGTAHNDLGQSLEFRSLLSVGYRLTDTSALSLAISHKSNAGLSPRNPGVNTLTLRYHHKF